MTPEELHRSLQGAASDLVFLDGDAPAEDWAVFVDRLGPLAAAAAACDCPILADAGELAGRIAAVLAAGDPGNPDAAVEHLNTLLTLMGVRAEELAEDRPPAQTYKAELAAARVYLDDLAGDEAPPAATATPAEDDEAAEFRQVMRGRIDAVEALLLGAEDTADEAELLRSVFREFHTLKGETGILGLTDLHNFFHDAESRMEPLRSESLSITADLVDALMAVADTSRRLIDGATGDDATTDDARAVLLDALGGAVAAAPPAEARTPDATDAATGEDDDAFFAAMADPPPAPDAASAQGAEDLFLQGAGASGEAEPTAPPLPDADAAEAPVPETEGVQVIPVDVGRIDSLLDLVATTTASAVQVGRHPLLAEQADTALRADLAILQRSIASLQDLAAGLRMTPVRPLFQRMRRVAYDVGRSSHKRVDIDVEGADTEVDRSVVENLTGALVHLIRNAIDHGIEAPADRRAAGKPERGRLLLRARRAGSNVAIEVVDDGAGIDPERVRAAAVGRGVIAPDARLPDRELRELIFHPGFSTAARVTGVSGRGVGMDAVRSAVEHLRGRVEVDSTLGRGTTVRILAPLALAAIEGLVARIGETDCILPVTAVRESLSVRPDAVSTVEGRGAVVAARGTLLPLIVLGEALGLSHRTADPTEGVVIILEHEGRLAAALVDEVVATQQVMVRPLEGALARVRQVSGTAALGGRGMGLVLEAGALLAGASTVDGRELAGAARREGAIETVDIGSNQVGMVDFVLRHRVGGKAKRSSYAINAFKAREFVPDAALTPVPHAPPGFAGILLLRDQTIPVVDLAALLGYESADAADGTIIICEFGSAVTGIRVSEVNRVHYISWSDIKPPPDTGAGVPTAYVVGTILMGEEVVLVLDFEHIVQQVMQLYKEFGASLDGVERRKTGSRVLLAEDSAIVRKKIAAALTAAGLEVIEAANGQEAHDLLLGMAAEAEAAGGSIFDLLDLVLTDIEMPQLDGYTLANTVKTHPTLLGLPVILQSSLTNETIVQRAREVHADGVVGKHDPAELARQLRQYL